MIQSKKLNVTWWGQSWWPCIADTSRGRPALGKRNGKESFLSVEGLSGYHSIITDLDWPRPTRVGPPGWWAPGAGAPWWPRPCSSHCKHPGKVVVGDLLLATLVYSHLVRLAQLVKLILNDSLAEQGGNINAGWYCSWSAQRWLRLDQWCLVGICT